MMNEEVEIIPLKHLFIYLIVELFLKNTFRINLWSPYAGFKRRRKKNPTSVNIRF